MVLERGVVLLACATLIAALVAVNVTFTVPAVIGLAILCAVILVEFPGERPPAWIVTPASAVTLVWLALRPPVGDVISTPWLVPGLAVGAVAAVLVAVLPLLPSTRWLTAAALAGMAVSFGLVILGGHPLIDVWVMLRDAGAGLLHGRNPYELAFPDVPPGEDDYCFPYAPGAFLLTAPGQWLLGDVRWLESAYLVGAIVLVAWHARNRGRVRDDGAVPLALLLGVLPGTLHVVEQSWTEPMLLLSVVVAAILVDRNRPNWAILPLAAALATKQYMVVLLPLLFFWPAFGWRRVVATGALAGAVCLPWFLANPQRFVACTVGFHLHFPQPAWSLSVWQLLPDPLKIVAVLAALAIAYVVVVRRAPRSGAGFLMGAGTVLAAFDVTNKSTFLNEWWFAAELIVAGLAIAAVGPAAAGAKARSELP
jgi:hypothetical protein